MSSAILYVAIVAIWIGVLVPRWLRHEHTGDGHLRLRRFSRGHQRAGGTAARAGFSEDGHPRYTSFGGDGQAERPQTIPADPVGHHGRDFKSQKYDSLYVSAPVSGNISGMAQPYEADVAPVRVRSYGWSAEEYLRQERRNERASRTAGPGTRPGARNGSTWSGGSGKPIESAGPGSGKAAGAGKSAGSTRDSGERPETAAREQRARMIRGRRRMLSMLLVLAVAAVGAAYLGLAAWWITVPPTVLLAGYLLVLREAAHADAEARERQARERSAAMARRAREAQQAREAQRAADAQRRKGTGSSPAWPAPGTLQPAEIIDISERVGDQLYDQYADAQLRAVGD